MEETKKVLEKQLQLLSEQTAQAEDGEEVTRLSQAMVDVSKAIKEVCGVKRDYFWDSHRYGRIVGLESDLIATKKTARRRYLFLLLIQLIQGLAIILHKLGVH